MYMILAAALVGAAASGETQSRPNPLRPGAGDLLFSGDRAADPVLRRHGPAARRAMHRQVRSIKPSCFCRESEQYCLLTALFAGPLLLLFGSQFCRRARRFSALFSRGRFLTYAQTIIAAALTAKHQTRYIFAGSVCGAIVALTVGVPSIKFMGVYGALTTMLLTAVTVTLLYWKAYRSTLPASEIARETPGEIADSMKGAQLQD